MLASQALASVGGSPPTSPFRGGRGLLSAAIAINAFALTGNAEPCAQTSEPNKITFDDKDAVVSDFNLEQKHIESYLFLQQANGHKDSVSLVGGSSPCFGDECQWGEHKGFLAKMQLSKANELGWSKDFDEISNIHALAFDASQGSDSLYALASQGDATSLLAVGEGYHELLPIGKADADAYALQVDGAGRPVAAISENASQSTQVTVFNILNSNSGEGVTTTKINDFTMAHSHMNQNSVLMADEGKFFMAGSADHTGALAAFDLAESEISLLTVPDAQELETIFSGYQESAVKFLYGTYLSKTEDEGLWSVALNDKVEAIDASAKSVVLASQASIASVLPDTTRNAVHLVVSSGSDVASYVVYDLENERVEQAVPFTAPSSPIAALLKLRASQAEAVFMTADSALYAIPEPEDTAESDEEEACDFEDLLEQMHIAFMQSEALRFESGVSVDVIEATIEAETFNFDEDADAEDERQGFEGDHESNDFSSSGKESSTLGDVRVFQSDDEDKEEDEDEAEAEDENERVVKERRRLDDSPPSETSETDGEISFCGDSSNDTSTDGTGQKCPRNIGWNDQNNGNGNGGSKGGFGNGKKDWDCNKNKLKICNRHYTITDDEYTFCFRDIRKFNCIYEYEISNIEPELEEDLYDFDPATQTFTVYWDTDLVPAGICFTDYTITIKATAAFDGAELFEDFILRIKNPCCDDEFRELTQEFEMLETYEYIIGDGDDNTPQGLTFDLVEPLVITLPNAATEEAKALCNAETTYSAIFTGDDSQISDTSEPISIADTDFETFLLRIFDESDTWVGTQYLFSTANTPYYPVLSAPPTLPLAAPLSTDQADYVDDDFNELTVIDFISPCVQTPNLQVNINPNQDDVEGTYDEELRFTITRPIKTVPQACDLTFVCEQIVFGDGSVTTEFTCDDFDTLAFTFDGQNLQGYMAITIPPTEYVNGNVPPGVYTVTMRATAIGTTVSDTLDYTITILDPCDPPTSLDVNAADLIPVQSYKLYDDALVISADVFTIVPGYCPYTITQSIGSITPPVGDGVAREPIIYDSTDLEWTVSYSSDLELIGKTQTVTYSAVSSSLYTTTDTIDAEYDFDVTYTDPCPTGTYTFNGLPQLPYEYIMTNPTATEIPYPTITADPAVCISSQVMTLSAQTQVIESNNNNGDGLLVIRDADAQSNNGDWNDVASIDVTITFTVKVGSDDSNPFIENSYTGTLTLRSPCLQSLNVVAVAPFIDTVYSKKNVGFTYNFADFPATQNVAYSQALTFCGDLTYTASTNLGYDVIQVNVQVEDPTQSVLRIDVANEQQNGDQIFYQITATWSQATFQSYDLTNALLEINQPSYNAATVCADNGNVAPCYTETGQNVVPQPPPENSVLPPFQQTIIIEDFTTTGEFTFTFTEVVFPARRRQLTSSNIAYYEQIITDDFMEIKATSKVSDMDPVNVNWHLKDFDGQRATVQMDLQDLMQKANLVEVNSISITFKDSEGNLQSANGNKLAYGQTLEFEIPPLVEESKSKSANSIGDLWLSLVWVALAITFLLAIFQGSLVTTFVFVNSLQLIAHVPLISTRLPPNAHQFLLNFLGLTRLNFKAFNEAVDSMDAKLREFELLEDADNAFGAHLRNNGYHFSMVRNMLFGMVLFGLVGLVWGFTALFKRCNRSQQSEQAQARRTSKEVWMNNFVVRFLLLASFEVMICSFIQLTDLNGPGGAFWWFMGLVFILASCAAIVGVGSMFFVNGPYVASYEPESLISSFWGIRELAPSILNSDKKPVQSKQMALDELYSINFPKSEAPTVTNSGVPLNQQMGAAINLNEGGQLSECATDRGCPTDRAMISDQSKEQPAETEEEILAKRMQSEAKLRLQLEDLVKVNGRYATLFNGLKVNTAHNSAVVEVLFFLVRRLVFAAVIVHMGQSPQIAMALMIALSLFSLIFTAVEQPWKDPVTNKLAIANEVFFYVVLLLALSCSSVTTADSDDEEVLGYVIMVVVTAAIHLNLIVMMSEAYNHAKLLFKRRENQKQHEIKMIADRLAKQAKADIEQPQLSKIEEEEKEQACSREDPSLIMPQVDLDTFDGEIDLSQSKKQRPQSHKQNDVMVELEKLSVVDEDFVGEQRLVTPEAGMMRAPKLNTEESILAAVEGVHNNTPSQQPISSLKFSKDAGEQSAFAQQEPVELGSSINGSKLESEKVPNKLDEPIDSFEQVDDLIDMSVASDHANRKPVVEAKEKNLKTYIETLAVNDSIEGKSVVIPKESSFEYVPTMNGQALKDQVQIQQQWANVMKDTGK